MADAPTPIEIDGESVSAASAVAFAHDNYSPAGWSDATYVKLEASGTRVIWWRPTRQERREVWRAKHTAARALRRQPHPNRVYRESRREVYAKWVRAKRDMEAQLTGWETPLELACGFAGCWLGIDCKPGEGVEEYRDRLLATGQVIDIRPGTVVLPGVAKHVPVHVGFEGG